MRPISLFAGFQNAVRSMQHAQSALAVHGSNIAHANDEHYTRRTVPGQTVSGPTGPGIMRLRDTFLDDQYRHSAALLGAGEARYSVVTKVEALLGDPIEGGLRRSIDDFFNSWQVLAETPADGVARLQVLSSGQEFVFQIRSIHQRLSDLEARINEEVNANVGKVNHQLEQVQHLNVRIAQADRSGLDSSAMRDQRDMLLDDLAKTVGATSVIGQDGSARVFVGTLAVVDGPTLHKLKMSQTETGMQPVWDIHGSRGGVTEGTIGGLLSARDQVVGPMMAEIDRLGKTVANQVNALHKRPIPGTDPQEFEGPDFFLVTDFPGDILLNPALTPEGIIADGGSQTPSDGENARRIARLGETGILTSVIMPEQEQSPRVFYRNLVGWLGNQGQDARLAFEIGTAQVSTVDQYRQADWGVSLDEEVAHLTMQQKAFAASARVIATMDEMLDTLINRTMR